jgi:hypothetical protein
MSAPIDNRQLNIAIEAAKQLRMHISALVTGDSEDDQQTREDSFEGETTLDVELERAILAEDNDVVLKLGIEVRQAELKGRLDRIEKRIEARRGLIEQAMIVAGWKKKETPLGTVSLKDNPPSVEIVEESSVPTQFFKRADPTLDKAGIRKVLLERHKAIEEAKKIEDDDRRAAALRRAEETNPEIPGCQLNAGTQSLTIRRK